VRHLASPGFWEAYDALPLSIRNLADENFELLKVSPRHPSLHYKRIGHYRSVRVGRKYRALAVEVPEGILWFWIGTHPEYDKLLASR